MSTTTPPIALPTITLLIPNMHCPSCVESITSILSPVPYLRNLNVSLLVRSVIFQVDTSIGPSGKRKPIGDVEEDVKRLLELEGGFIVDAHHGEGHRLATRASQRKPRQRSLLPWTRRSKGQTAEYVEEERRARHLAHCEVCQEEEARPSQAIIQTALIDSAQVARTTFSISGMTCASCVQAISSALLADSRIIKAEVDLLSSSGVVCHYTKFPAEDIADEIEDLGYGAEVLVSVFEPPESPPTYVEGSIRLYEAQYKQEDVKMEDAMFKTTFSIEGMTCSSCSNAISSALRDFPGVQSMTTDVIGNSATVHHAGTLSISDIIETIEGAGYGAKEVSSVRITSELDHTSGATQNGQRTIHVVVQGTYCHKCITQLNNALPLLPILRSTLFSLKDPSTKITYDPRRITIRQILKFLDDLAPEFEARIVKARSVTERSREIQAREVRNLAVHLGVAVVFAIPTFIIAIVGMILLPNGNGFKDRMMKPVWGAANVATVVLWPLATVVQFGVGRLFYVRALAPITRRAKLLWQSAGRHRSALARRGAILTWRSLFNFGSMDLLVALSTTVAYSSSVAMLIIDARSTSSHSIGTYFDSSVFLIMFILLGRVLEAYAKSRTTDAVSLLGQLRPETALLVETPSSPEALSDEAPVAAGSPTSSPVIRRGLDMESRLSGDIATVPEKQLSTHMNRTTRTIPVDHLERGDLILIPPGSFPPTDGTIVLGQSTFDESSLTGESRPVTKSAGDQIYTGTTNLSSAITIRITSLPSETMLDSIIGAVSNASTHKAPIEKLAERLTGVFVPIIVYLSLVVLSIWLSLALTGHLESHGNSNGGQVFFAIEFAIATLVVACPCGIGLAVPCANAVGNGLAAKMGILASGGGEAFLAATKVGTVVLDKTGTLTEGKCQVTDERAYGLSSQGMSAEKLKKAILEVERGSTHPLAKGLVQHFEVTLQHQAGTEFEVVSTEEIPGRGIKAVVRVGCEHWEILLGSSALLSDNHLELLDDQKRQMEAWYDQAKSAILVAVRIVNTTASPDDTGSSTANRPKLESGSISAKSEPHAPFELVHAYALSDPPRPSSPSAIALLHKRRVRVMMLSGDSFRTAKAVAKMVGIPQESVIAGVGPLQKADVIRDLQQESSRTAPRSFIPEIYSKIRIGKRSSKESEAGRNSKLGQKVMFVGDGLNDAVALAAADVSVAMGHGSQAVLAGSDFVLLSSSLSALPSLFALSRKVYNRQRLNLLWAIIFNLVCIPFAAGVFYPAGRLRLTPVWSAVLMALSSVSVVLSSLAMRWGL